MWLAFAVLPLTLEQLHSAVAIEIGMYELDEESCLSSPQDILSLCGSLISLSSLGQIRLAHLSVKDFLLSSEASLNNACSTFAMNSTDANHELALNCLTYLFFAELGEGPTQTSDDYANRLAHHSFLKHAAMGWTYYARASVMAPDLEALILEFFNPKRRQHFMSWVQVLNAIDSTFKWDLYPRHATPLYYGASFGLKSIVEQLIKEGAELDAPGSRFGGTALHAAVLRQHVLVMKVLLEAGADPNRVDFNRVSPLHTAVGYGDPDVIRLLLEFRALKDAVDGVGETPMVWARKAGQIEARDLLLGIEPKAKKRSENISAQQVWRRCKTYFPCDFHESRSGLESSIIIKVEIGNTTLGTI